MGFYEDDRIRNKNRKYNFPTPDINYAAHKCIKSINLKGEALVSELLSRRDSGDDTYDKETLDTAVIIVMESL